MRILLFSLLVLVSVRARATPLKVVDDGIYDSGQVFTSCSLEGAARLCKIDSGGDLTNVSDTGAVAKLSAIDKVNGTGAGGAVKSCDIVELRNFMVGELNFYKHEAMRCTKSDAGNVLGFDIFLGKTVGLNFKDHVFEITDDPIPSRLQRSLYKSDPTGRALIPATIGGTTLDSLWDTGAGLSNVNDAYAQAHPEIFVKTAELDQGEDFNGAPLKLMIYTVKEIKIGAKTFNNVVVAGINRGADSSDAKFAIGFNLIRHANWFLDTRMRSWVIY